jgi:hypothetical protein
MSTDFSKNGFGQNQKKTKRPSDVLVGKFCRLRYESLGKDYYNQNRHNLEQYGNLHIKKEVQKFDKAKERMKQQMIISDNSKDNSVLYTAMTQFKKNHE